MKRYKVLGRFVPVGTYDVPDEVLSLVVDMQRIDLALTQLRTVNESNITSNLTAEDREFGRKMKWVTIRAIESWKRYGELKLRNEYLCK